MNSTGKSRTICFWAKKDYCSMMMLCAVLLFLFAEACLSAENENREHYKMLSTIEYAGKGQFVNQAETLFTVRKEFLSDNKVEYFISTGALDLIKGNWSSGEESQLGELSFIVDKKTRQLSTAEKDLLLLEMVNNRCVGSLEKVTKENIGKTWKQSFNLSFLGKFFPSELKFTLTAIQLEAEAFGEMIAVRALSEPFVVQAAREDGGTGSVKSRINAVYLFDPKIEDIYLSISVFDATTDFNGFKETLRHEVATYRTDAAGVSVDLTGLDKKFEKLVRKVGLTTKGLKVDKETPLPGWAQSRGLRAAQIANICAAMACEGASNPVATISMPAARMVALQGAGQITAAARLGTISSLLVKSIPGVGGMKIAAAPAFMGVGAGTAGAIAGGSTAIAIGMQKSSRSPSD